ncbi:MAG: 50S ribosomal protein L32 [Acidobacteriota bacterium]
MANPKARHSKARRNKRRAHDHLTRPALSICPNCGDAKRPHRVCPSCGYYRGRVVIQVDDAF